MVVQPRPVGWSVGTLPRTGIRRGTGRATRAAPIRWWAGGRGRGGDARQCLNGQDLELGERARRTGHQHVLVAVAGHNSVDGLPPRRGHDVVRLVAEPLDLPDLVPLRPEQGPVGGEGLGGGVRVVPDDHRVGEVGRLVGADRGCPVHRGEGAATVVPRSVRILAGGISSQRVSATGTVADVVVVGAADDEQAARPSGRAKAQVSTEAPLGRAKRR